MYRALLVYEKLILRAIGQLPCYHLSINKIYSENSALQHAEIEGFHVLVFTCTALNIFIMMYK